MKIKERTQTRLMLASNPRSGYFISGFLILIGLVLLISNINSFSSEILLPVLVLFAIAAMLILFASKLTIVFDKMTGKMYYDSKSLIMQKSYTKELIFIDRIHISESVTRDDKSGRLESSFLVYVVMKDGKEYRLGSDVSTGFNIRFLTFLRPKPAEVKVGHAIAEFLGIQCVHSKR